MPQQLVLDIKLPDTATFSNYVAANNLEAVQFLQNTFLDRVGSYVYLWGANGTGKTHLLQACCHEALAQGTSAFYLDLADYQQLAPEILQGLEQYHLVCLDNMNAVTKETAWQEALFYFYNRSKDNRRCLLISADKAPVELDLKLADLKSRLSWGLILHLNSLEDKDKLLILQKHAKNKGINLSNEVCQYILNHHSRDTHRLMQLLEKIDKQSLIEKRRVTIPFLRSLL